MLDTAVPVLALQVGQVVAVQVAAESVTIDLGGEDTRIVRRTTTQPARSVKAHRPHQRSAGAAAPGDAIISR